MANLLSNAECGPSNALSTLSKHSQQDKTIQQDRWVQGHARPAESFRSPELHQGPDQVMFQRDAQQFFQQANRISPSHPETQFQRSIIPGPQMPAHDFEDDWHRQFQRVNISSPTPLPQILSSRQQQLGKQPEYASPTTWQDEFTQFEPPPPHFSYQPQVQHRLANMAYAAGPPIEQLHSQTSHYDPKLEDEAFEMAFAEAENAVLPSTAGIVEAPEPEVQKLSEKEEADQLAQTAGELFDRLRHERETDDKFRNSSFMALMKRLRDREIVVSGNDMVESTSVQNITENEGVEESVSM